MARITLTSAFSRLESWPGRLFDAEEGGSITTRTATALTWRFGSDATFAGFEIRITGTGFAYDAGEAVAGRMARLQIANAADQVILTIGDLGPGLPGSLSDFWYSFFGSSDPDSGPDGDPTTVWSHLLQGNDTVIGDPGENWQGFPGYDAGNDRYDMGRGDGQVNGGIGNDTYLGGDGYDVISFEETHFNLGQAMLRGANINLASGVVLDPWGGRDRLSGFEEAKGSRLGDVITGDTEQNTFYGLRGADTIDGGANSFNPDGSRNEDRRDWLRYNSDADLGGLRGIVVDLEKTFANGSIRGTIRDGFGHVDTVIDIERVGGTIFNDVFVGSRAGNQFRGGEGRDSYDGGGEFDIVDLGRGWRGDPGGARIDLTRGSGQIIDDGFGNTETIRNIEGIFGTARGDSFRGNGADNYFEGREGADTMTGGGGADEFVWTSADELGQGDRVTDFRSGTDSLAFEVSEFQGMTGTLTLVNGRNATAARGSFVFDAASDTLFWDRDGSGAAAKQVVAVLVGVSSLTAVDIDLWV